MEPPGATAMETSAFIAPLKLYHEAFAELDPARRGDLLVRCLTEEAQIWGPKRVFAGYAAISEKIEGFHKNWPGARLVLASGLYIFGNLARFAIALVSSDGTVAASGEAVIELAQDGRIFRVIPFWEALPPIPESWPGHLAAYSKRETPNAA